MSEANTYAGISDGRPAHWTEAAALVYAADDRAIGDHYDVRTFCQMFAEGDWKGVQELFPTFDAFAGDMARTAEPTKPALFTLDGVEFLEPDLPYQPVAWKVRVDGREFYVCHSFPVPSDRAAIIPVLAEQARQLRPILAPAADR